MDPNKAKNVRKDPFGQSGMATVTNQTKINQPNTYNPPQEVPSQNLPPSSVKHPISNKSLVNPSQGKFTSSYSDIQQPSDDQGMKEYESLKIYNSSKNFIRTTSEKLPANSGILKEASFPIGMILNPYCNSEGELPLVNYGEKDIPRCVSPNCRAYINPFIKWIEGGEKWVCNICGYINDTADYYYNRLDKNNYRIDMHDKHDISCGSYEFIANATYVKKDKQVSQPVYLFIIDVSTASYQNGFLSSVLETIKELIKSEEFSNIEKVKVILQFTKL
jgi:protein transport protein SEC24